MGNFLPVLSNTSRDSVMMQNRLKGSQLKIIIIYLIHNFFEILIFQKSKCEFFKKCQLPEKEYDGYH